MSLSLSKPHALPPDRSSHIETPLCVARAMPNRLVIVRHGESEANILQKLWRKGALRSVSEELQNLPNREFRLTELGRKQSDLTGPWLAREYPTGFDVVLVSDFVRAMETAGRVCLAAGWGNISIEQDPKLAERNWGGFNQATQEEQKRFMDLRERNPIHGHMPDGETLLSTRTRARILLERCSREYGGKNVLVFGHGEFIEALWAEIAHLSTETQKALFQSKAGSINNCQVVEFSSVSTS